MCVLIQIWMWTQKEDCFCLVAQSCPTLLHPHGLCTRLLWSWGFSGKNTRVCCHFLLHRIFLTPKDQTHVFCTGRQILYHWATREASKGGHITYNLQYIMYIRLYTLYDLPKKISYVHTHETYILTFCSTVFNRLNWKLFNRLCTVELKANCGIATHWIIANRICAL